MKRTLFTMGIWAMIVSPVMASIAIEFSPGNRGGAAAGGWQYDGAGALSFKQSVLVDLVDSLATDPLVIGPALIHIPDLVVGGLPGGPFTVSGGPLKITDATGSTVYLTATVEPGALVPVGTTAALFSIETTDLTAVEVTEAGLALGSPALDRIAALPPDERDMDFELSLQGAPQKGFQHMLEHGLPGDDGFSGTLTIPEPATLMIMGLAAAASFLRRRTA